MQFHSLHISNLSLHWFTNSIIFFYVFIFILIAHFNKIEGNKTHLQCCEPYLCCCFPLVFYFCKTLVVCGLVSWLFQNDIFCGGPRVFLISMFVDLYNDFEVKNILMDWGHHSLGFQSMSQFKKKNVFWLCTVWYKISMH
jgi:hypothetical protein